MVKLSSIGMFLVMTVFVVSVPGSARAQDNQTNTTTVAAADREFMMSAAHDGLMEVEAGTVAVEKATNADVKRFAQQIVDDHTKANAELTRIASAKGVTLPAQSDEKHMAVANKMKADLTKKTGADFDREFVKLMVKDHTKAVQLFERASQSAQDAEVKAFAASTLPTLRTHLQTATDLETSLKGPKPTT